MGVQAKFCTQVNVGERSVGGDLDEMVTQRTVLRSCGLNARLVRNTEAST